MCGISGIYSFTGTLDNPQHLLKEAVNTLRKRGPEVQAYYIDGSIALGHSRLSIIDTTDAANQPFTDETGRYTLVFNGEIYNYKNLRQQLTSKGVTFVTQSDTEVLLQWMIYKGTDGISDLQGFFAFAFYDSHTHTMILVRDRFGIKPFYYYCDTGKIIFASEMKAMLAMDIPRELDHASLQAYFQLNYIPAPWSIYRNVFKLMPGHYMIVKKDKVETDSYYQIPFPEISPQNISYDNAIKKLREKLEQAVVKRLVADVPLGAFLSGGIDSSIVVALASRHVDQLNTFSIGFKDEPMFDETHFAESVARMHKTNHTVFSLTHQDLFQCLYDVLDYTDEPFADSSALAVYILSRETRKKVTVALSGDGADEMFAGYNKHMAEHRVQNAGLLAHSLGHLYPLLSVLPQSRSGYFSNRIRQMHRFGKGMKLPIHERYWQWASFQADDYTNRLLKNTTGFDEFLERKKTWLRFQNNTINEVLYNDMQLVLPNDMLTKVDLMSMANSLEVRVPFLDHDVVNFVFSLPEAFKIDKTIRKKILKDAFRNDLPAQLYNRPKQGFEVPLLGWFQGELSQTILKKWLADDYIEEQNVFNPVVIKDLKKQLFSHNPGEIHAQIWSLIVFQHWFETYHQKIQ